MFTIWRYLLPWAALRPPILGPVSIKLPSQTKTTIGEPAYGRESYESPILHPVILVPGDGGSQIEARLNRSSSDHWWCYTHSDWFDLWLNLEQLIPWSVDCWQENMRLVYNRTARATYNVPGVETRIPGFGNTSSVEWLDKSKRSVGEYFADIVESLLPLGYIRGSNIHGAPYDFRKAAHEHGDYFDKLKILIETSSEKNGNMAVVLVTHSMGSIMAHTFLSRQSQSWKERYIRSLVSIAGVWGGTMTAVKVFAVGDNLRSYFLNERKLLWQRTTSSLAWLMPPRDFWDDEDLLVETPSRNYTRIQLPEFFADIDPDIGKDMAAMVEDTQDILKSLPPPGVEVHCLHSSGLPSVERLQYAPGYFPANDPVQVMGDGDGTVNIRSLTGCLRWRGQQKQAVHHAQYKGLDHLAMLRDPEIVSYVSNLLRVLNNEVHQGFDKVQLSIL